jgi:hypothetical protein
MKFKDKLVLSPVLAAVWTRLLPSLVDESSAILMAGAMTHDQNWLSV